MRTAWISTCRFSCLSKSFPFLNSKDMVRCSLETRRSRHGGLDITGAEAKLDAKCTYSLKVHRTLQFCCRTQPGTCHDIGWYSSDGSRTPPPNLGSLNMNLAILSNNRLKPVDTSRLVSQRGKPDAVSIPLLLVINVVVGNGCVGRDTVIPQRDSPFLPFDTDLEILTVGDVL